jgi:hypothetical protein
MSTGTRLLVAPLVAWVAIALPAGAAEPESCERSVGNVEASYRVQLSTRSIKTGFRVDGVKEIGFGPTVREPNSVVPPNHYGNSRYCQASVKRVDGESDTVFYRIDGLRDPANKDYNFNACFLKFNPRQNECKHTKPGS